MRRAAIGGVTPRVQQAKCRLVRVGVGVRVGVRIGHAKRLRLVHAAASQGTVDHQAEAAARREGMLREAAQGGGGVGQVVRHADAIDVVEAAELERAQIEQRSPHEAHTHARVGGGGGGVSGGEVGGGVDGGGVGGGTVAVPPWCGQQAARREPRPGKTE
eukprot:scaffold36291_cov39-Phaeocystis_antarctica.AAC.1